MLNTVMLTFLALLSPLALPPTQDDVLVDLEHGGLSAILVDEKDAGLLQGLRLIPLRLAELMAEQGDPDIPPKGMVLLGRLLDGATRFTLDFDPSRGPVARLALREKDAGAAAELLRGVRTFLTETGATITDTANAEGWYEVAEDPPGWIGARDNVFELHVGERTEARPAIGVGALPEGARVAFAAEVDLARALELIGPEIDLVLPKPILDLLAGRARYVLGHDDVRAHEAFIVLGGTESMRAAGLLGAPLDLALLRMIPRDATWAEVMTVEPTKLMRLIESVVADEVDIAAEVRSELGLDLYADLIDPLGGAVGAYASDTTGGGGLTSSVLFAKLDDPERFAATLANLEEQLNGVLEAEADGWVQVRTWTHADHLYHSLTFPGLPVPFQPSLTIAGDVLLAGATPQAAVAAREHLRAPRGNVLEHPGLLAQLPEGGLKDAYTLGFLDSPRMIESGYGLASLVASALANGVRSRSGSLLPREAGLVLPPYADLARDARCWVEWTTIEGEDVVVRGVLDRSMAVNLTALAGSAGESTFVMIGLMSSAIMPRMLDALSDARERKVYADLYTINQALTQFVIRNSGRFPDNLVVLVTPDANGLTYLDMRELPRDPWGNLYVYAPPSGTEDFKLMSFGADGKPGGVGEDRDISFDELR
ncbi:MAG: hypothetical protein GY711_18650 [bacterium]|nr:hypothetical protein [bacterium]